MDMESKVLWYPDSKRNTQMDKFRIQVNANYGLNLGEWRGGSGTKVDRLKGQTRTQTCPFLCSVVVLKHLAAPGSSTVQRSLACMRQLWWR